MQVRNVGIAGPRSTLGPSIIKHLLATGSPPTITLLSRSSTETSLSFPTLNTLQANYDSVDELVQLLTSPDDGKPLFDVVISLLKPSALQPQKNLIDAVAQARIPHFIPSSFTVDLRLPYYRTFPPLAPKREVEDYLLEKASRGLPAYTIIQTGIFLDLCLSRNIIMNFNNSLPIAIFDGGDVKFSATMLDDVGGAVANSLLKTSEMRNRYCCIQTAAVSQNQLLRIARELFPDKTWETIGVDTAAEEREAEDKRKRGEEVVMRPGTFVLRGSFREGNGLFKDVDNEFLGMKGWEEEELRQLIRSVIVDA
ncbi:NAD(P)-binding protein [Cadophora sp. DSE1049]|nr:NAD(P)-binding protein [Cadophora sp. DSE1049]